VERYKKWITETKPNIKDEVAYWHSTYENKEQSTVNPINVEDN